MNNQITIGDNSLYFNASVYKAEIAQKTKPSMASVAVSGLPVTPGYDLATGLGSPKAANFVLDVAAARVAREQIKLP